MQDWEETAERQYHDETPTKEFAVAVVCFVVLVLVFLCGVVVGAWMW